jgi:outer membrane murein-binding lipoprotein Lpp
MRYLVIASCQDVRTGKEFEAGEEFLPEPDVGQAVRLKNAGCLREIPDNAPALPGSDDSAQIIVDLRTKPGKTASKAEGEYNALNARLSELTSQHGNLVEEYKAVRGQIDAANDDLSAARTENDRLTTLNAGLTARVAELDSQMAAAAKPAANASGDDQVDGGTTKPPKAKH